MIVVLQCNSMKHTVTDAAVIKHSQYVIGKDCLSKMISQAMGKKYDPQSFAYMYKIIDITN